MALLDKDPNARAWEPPRKGVKPWWLDNGNSKKTHCPKGHPLEGDNLDPWAKREGRRVCYTCHRRLQVEKVARSRRAIRDAAPLLGISNAEFVRRWGTRESVATGIYEAITGTPWVDPGPRRKRDRGGGDVGGGGDDARR